MSKFTRKVLDRFRDKGAQGPKVFLAGLEVYGSPASANVDIIFIHGLTGGREKTWTASNATRPWFETLLSSSCPTARILAFGYDAYVADYKSVVSENRIENHAKNLLSAVAQHRDSDGTNTRSIIFVAHSLGGLVCIETLLASKNSADRHLQSILDTTVAIAFLGTPHSGSALAKWGELLAISVGILNQTNSNIVSVLRRESEVLARLQSEFHTMIREKAQRGGRQIKITCFYEELPIPGIGTVVPKESAILPQYISIGIHADHREMTKFSESRDPGFKSIAGELQRWIRDDLISNEPPPTELPAQATRAASLSQIVDWGGLRQSLSPTEASKEHSSRRRAHLPGTAEWIFEFESYREWATNNAASPLLWVNGRPGCGKSILAFNIVQHLRKIDNSIGTLLVINSYCMHDANENLQSYSVLRTLAYQIALQYQDFAIQLCDLLQRYGLPHKDKDKSIYHFISCEAFWELFQGVLVNSSMKSASIFWIIDGLDEIEVEDRALLLDCAAEFCRTLPHCRVLILSRDEYDIRKHLLLIRAKEIKITDNFTKEDIQTYITYRIGVWGALGSGTIKNNVIESLNARAQGVFLWVKLVMDELERIHDLGKVTETLESLPGDMKELYNTVLQNLSARITEQEHRIFRSIISWVTLAQRTLTLNELASALCMQGSFSAESLRISMQRLCGSLIILEDSEWRPEKTSVRLLHVSLADYLKSEGDESCKYSLNLGEAHGVIASSCLEQLRAVSQSPLFYPIGNAYVYGLNRHMFGELGSGWNKNGPLVIDPSSPEDISTPSFIIGPYVRNQFPLFSYAKEDWTYHVEQSSSNLVAGEATAKELVDLLLKGVAILIWLRSVDIWDDLRKRCVMRLLRFCDLMYRSDYLGIDIVYDFAMQIARGDRSGWAYRLGKMCECEGWHGIALDVDEVTVPKECITMSHKRQYLRCGIAAYTAGHYLLAMQAYADSCSIQLPGQSGLENLEQFTPELRRAKFATIADHICKGNDTWLLTIFGHALSSYGNAEWLAELISYINEKECSPKLLCFENTGQLFFSMGDYVTSARSYSMLSAKHPSRWDLKETMTSALRLQGQIESALNLLTTYGGSSNIPEMWCEKAWNEERRVKLCISSERLQDAIAICTDATLKYPEWWNLWINMSECLLQLGDVAAALDCLRAAQKQARVALLASTKIVETLIDDKRYDIAISESLSTIQNFPGHYEAYNTLRTCWKMSPESDKAKILSIFRSLMMEPEPYWVVCVHYARALMELKLFSEAVDVCQHSKAIKDNIIVTYTAAQAYEALSQSQEALNMLLEAPLERYNDNMGYLAYIAKLSHKLQRWADLRQALRRLKSMDPDWNANNAEALAWAHYNVKDYIDCEQECKEGLAKIEMSTPEEGDRIKQENAPGTEQFQQIIRLRLILVFVHASLGHVSLTLQQLLLITASNPLGWYEVANTISRTRWPSLISFCLDAGLQEHQMDSDAKTQDISRLTHTYWTCDNCKAVDFKTFAYTCVQCKLFEVCKECFEILRGAHQDGHSWIRCPSVAYPRLRVRGVGKERIRDIIDTTKVILDVVGLKGGEVCGEDPLKPIATVQVLTPGL